MKLSNKKIRKLIREAIENQIMRPDLTKGRLHHAYQQGVIPPELGIDDEELRAQIQTLRTSGDEGSAQADALAGTFTDSDEAMFGPPGSKYGDIEKARSEYDDWFGTSTDAMSDYLTGTDGFLRISYPMDDIVSNHDPSIDNSELNRIIKDSYEGYEGSLGSDPYRFERRIAEYVSNSEHAHERQKIAKAFARIDYDVLKNQSFEEYLQDSAKAAIEQYEQDKKDTLSI
jgi:hypothetical protein